jgi:hypothetical protein
MSSYQILSLAIMFNTDNPSMLMRNSVGVRCQQYTPSSLICCLEFQLHYTSFRYETAESLLLMLFGLFPIDSDMPGRIS